VSALREGGKEKGCLPDSFPVLQQLRKGKKRYPGMISIVTSEWDADDTSRVAHFGVRLLQRLVTSQRSVSMQRK
jgi:hypothetical protein